MDLLVPRCAGVDIGKADVVACVRTPAPGGGRRKETRTFQDRAAGIDERPVVSDAQEKQISSEETFDTDIRDHKEMQERLAQLADRTTARPRARQFKAGMDSIKVVRRDFENYTTFAPKSEPQATTTFAANDASASQATAATARAPCIAREGSTRAVLKP